MQRKDTPRKQDRGSDHTPSPSEGAIVTKSQVRTAAQVLALILLVLGLHARTIDDGLIFDDVPIGVRIQQSLAGTGDAAWWDVFRFGGFDSRLRFSGVLPWWTAEDLSVRFFRPVAAASHLFDQLAWPDSPELMHAQNLVWAIAMALSVLLVYRDLLAPKVAFVGAAIFSASYIHLWPVGWISNRNALMATAFGALALWAYRRWRLRSMRIYGIAPVCLAMSLLSAEAGVSIVAFIFAFEVMEGRAAPKGRWPKVAMVVGVVVLWQVTYTTMGFGAAGSGAYIDPMHSPVAFLSESPRRLGWLLFYALSPGEIIQGLDVSLELAWVIGGSFVLASLVAMIWGVRSRAHAVFAVGAALAIPPLLTSLPQPRLLTFVHFGLAPLIATTLVMFAGRSWQSSVGAFLLAIGPVIISPLGVIGLLKTGPSSVSSSEDGPGLNIGANGRVKGTNLVLMTTPNYERAIALTGARAAADKPAPAFVWVLSSGSLDPQIKRRGCCTLVLQSESGLLTDPIGRYFRGPQVPFQPGDVVKTLGFEARIESTSASGSPVRVAFAFFAPLSAKQLLFARWDGRDFRRVSVPSFEAESSSTEHPH